MPPLVEPRPRPLPGLREILGQAFGHNLVNGFAAFLFAASGPGAMILSVGAANHMPADFVTAWIFAGYGLSGLLSIVVCYVYRQPMTLAYSIPAIAIVGPALSQYSVAELVGAYVVTGLLIIVLALTGLVRRVTAALPEPIAMAMVAGVFLPFGLRLIGAFQNGAWVAGAMAAGYVAAAALPGRSLRVPPLLVALIAGAVAVAATGSFAAPQGLGLQTATPVVFRPEFSLGAIVEFVLPLTVTVIAIHNIQAFAIVRNAGYVPPERFGTLMCGIGTVVYGLMGSVPTVVTGPVNAILNLSGARETRYVGGMWCGLFFLIFGIFAPSAVQMGAALPAAFIAGLAGLAMLPVLQSAFVESFRGAFTFGALVTFLVTVSGVEIFGIGSAFWGLFFGYVASRLVERKDFRRAADLASERETKAVPESASETGGNTT